MTPINQMETPGSESSGDDSRALTSGVEDMYVSEQDCHMNGTGAPSRHINTIRAQIASFSLQSQLRTGPNEVTADELTARETKVTAALQRGEKPNPPWWEHAVQDPISGNWFERRSGVVCEDGFGEQLSGKRGGAVVDFGGLLPVVEKDGGVTVAIEPDSVEVQYSMGLQNLSRGCGGDQEDEDEERLSGSYSGIILSPVPYSSTDPGHFVGQLGASATQQKSQTTRYPAVP